MDPDRFASMLGLWSGGPGPLYRQLATAVVGLVDAGVLRPNDQLPPERATAEALSVSRGTVVRAFEQLVELDVVGRVQGSGTTVLGRAAVTTPVDFVGEPLWADGARAIDLLKAIPSVLPGVIDAMARVDLGRFEDELDTAEPLGWQPVRAAIADLVSTPDATVSPGQVMVTSGAQQAISLVLRAVVVPGDVVLGEAFTWPGLIDVVHSLGARFEPVAVDGEGLDVDDLEHKIQRFRPAALAINPQHQNPTGTRLPPERVAAVARLAAQHGVLVIEDRVAADLGFDRRALPTIASADADAPVVTIGSLCKIGWPGLRLGWMYGDPSWVQRVRPHKALDDMFTSALSQAAAVEVIADYDTIVAERVDQLRQRCDLVATTIGEVFPDWSFAPPRGGMCLWIELPGRTSGDAFAQHAARYGVLVASGRQFAAVDGDSGQLRIPFTANPGVLAEGLRRLASAWSTFDRSATEAVSVW